MLTVGQLRSWTTTAWDEAGSNIDDRAALENATAWRLEFMADMIQKAWDGETGGIVARVLRKEAAGHREWPPILDQVKKILASVTASMAAYQGDLVVQMAEASQLAIVVDDSGSCSMPDLPISTTPRALLDRIKLSYATMAATRKIRPSSSERRAKTSLPREPSRGSLM